MKVTKFLFKGFKLVVDPEGLKDTDFENLTDLNRLLESFGLNDIHVTEEALAKYEGLLISPDDLLTTDN